MPAFGLQLVTEPRLTVAWVGRLGGPTLAPAEPNIKQVWWGDERKTGLFKNNSLSGGTCEVFHLLSSSRIELSYFCTCKKSLRFHVLRCPSGYRRRATMNRRCIQARSYGF